MALPAPASGATGELRARLAVERGEKPDGPNLFLSWATCELRPGGNQSRIYRCELRQGYRFAE